MMSAGRVLSLALAIVIALIVLGPLALLFSTSLKGVDTQPGCRGGELARVEPAPPGAQGLCHEQKILLELATPHAFYVLPDEAALTNYRQVLSDPQSPFLLFLRNSLIIVASIVLLGIVVNSLAAFALARLSFRGKGLLVAAVVALIIVPMEAVAVPLLLLTNRMGLLETLTVQIVPFIAHPFSIYLFYQFFTKLPKDLDEAALVEGATPLQIYWKIVMPLSLPVVATVAILQSLEYWNAYLWPLMVTRGPEARPLSLALAQFFGTPPPIWGDLMAFSVMISLPILIVYLAFQRWFIASVVGSAVKG
jgi:multiple sugar transport system permease protein